MSHSQSLGLPWVTAPAALAVLTWVGAIRTDRPLPVVLVLGVTALAAGGLLAWRSIAAVIFAFDHGLVRLGDPRPSAEL